MYINPELDAKRSCYCPYLVSDKREVFVMAIRI